MLEVIGKTSDEKMVVKNCFLFETTYGVGITDMLLHLKEHNMVPDWIDYYESAITRGVMPDTILSRVRVGTVDAYGELYKNEIINRIKLHIMNWRQNEKIL